LCLSVLLLNCILLLQVHVIGTRSSKFFENLSMLLLVF
jgi:hypothetical protein